MRLPSGLDEELELLDHLSSPELEERMKQEERQRELLSKGGRRGSSSGSSSESQGPLPPPKWGASLSPRRRDPSKPDKKEESGADMAYYSPDEFKKAFPNK